MSEVVVTHEELFSSSAENSSRRPAAAPRSIIDSVASKGGDEGDDDQQQTMTPDERRKAAAAKSRLASKRSSASESPSPARPTAATPSKLSPAAVKSASLDKSMKQNMKSHFENLHLKQELVDAEAAFGIVMQKLVAQQEELAASQRQLASFSSTNLDKDPDQEEGGTSRSVSPQQAGGLLVNQQLASELQATQEASAKLKAALVAERKQNAQRKREQQDANGHLDRLSSVVRDSRRALELLTGIQKNDSNNSSSSNNSDGSVLATSLRSLAMEVQSLIQVSRESLLLNVASNREVPLSAEPGSSPSLALLLEEHEHTIEQQSVKIQTLGVKLRLANDTIKRLESSLADAKQLAGECETENAEKVVGEEETARQRARSNSSRIMELENHVAQLEMELRESASRSEELEDRMRKSSIDTFDEFLKLIQGEEKNVIG